MCNAGIRTSSEFSKINSEKIPLKGPVSDPEKLICLDTNICESPVITDKADIQVKTSKNTEVIHSLDFNNDILFIGLNTEAGIEVNALRKNICEDSEVYFVHQSEAGPDTFKDTCGTIFNLNDEADINNFVQTLGLDPVKSAEVAEFIKTPIKTTMFSGMANNIKDEMAQIINIWSESEKGGKVPSRLLLSGHSVGDGITGESNGTLSISLIQNLAKLFPKAAGCVEDSHISGCSSGGEITIETYKEIFPNLKTEWTYTHSAPAAKNGAVKHEKIWEAETRDRKDTLDRKVAKGTYLYENVNTWSVKAGYQDGKPVKNLNDLMVALDDQTALFARFFMGYEVVKDPHKGTLRTYYELVQDILQSKQSKDLPPEKRKSIEELRDKSIRLLYYTKSISANFEKNFSQEIKKGYEAIGKTPPDFSKLTRAEAIVEIADYINNVAENEDAPEDAKVLLKLLKNGLKDLSREIIPDGWLG